LDGGDQERWAYVLDNGIVGEAEAQRSADEKWGSEEPEEEDELELTRMVGAAPPSSAPRHGASLGRMLPGF
jgi:hypothetical protein